MRLTAQIILVALDKIGMDDDSGKRVKDYMLDCVALRRALHPLAESSMRAHASQDGTMDLISHRTLAG